VSFDVDPAAYAAFMGRFSGPLAPLFADFAGVGGIGTALDVGCGTGALTAVLVERLGAASVSAVDPSEPFVAQVRDALPAVDVRRGRAEDLPFEGARFDGVLAQLVVHFMADPVAGIAEMARVARPGGVVAATVWDHAGGHGPLAAFWAAAREVTPGAPDESGLPGVREGHLAELFAAAGVHELIEGTLCVRVEHRSFEEWWQPYTLGVGPAGAHVAALDDEQRAKLRDRCAEMLPAGSFSTTAIAWAVRGRA
jgi:SAM-dependent methyltransferase